MATRTYTPMLEAVVEIDFLHAGKQLKKGDPFPHKAMGIDDLSLRGLFSAGLIRFTDTLAAPAPAIAVPRKEQHQRR